LTSKKFVVERDTALDFVGEAYATTYPNLHRYPATMIPQLGIAILERLGVSSGSLLDPYCGSGSSFAAGLHCGISEVFGFDLNPLAVLISKAKFTRIDESTLSKHRQLILKRIEKPSVANSKSSEVPKITNIDYWFPKSVILQLAGLKRVLDGVDDADVRDLALLAFSETVRDVSYTRKNEFKLYRIAPEKLEAHKPDTLAVFREHLTRIFDIYLQSYLPLLEGVKTHIENVPFDSLRSEVDLVLTSPPYGDSRTTVAYGQFSTLTNEWLGIEHARKIDSLLMGGKRVKSLLSDSVIAAELRAISEVDTKRALEVSSFYSDLGLSISEVAKAVRSGGHVVYIVGNRRVKDVQLSTDQFIAEEFEKSGFSHLVTYERLISSKSMPAVNSPSNKAGLTRGTMTQEFVVICKKI
jgi:hypothetical protein